MKNNKEIKLLIDFHLQPISNRYLQKKDEKEYLFPLKLGQCQKTGLIQLIKPVNYKELVPCYKWITYNEPEDHLNKLVDKIYNMLPKDKNLNVGGISFKDDSTLNRFSKKGCNTWRINLEQDLSLKKHVGIESIQASLNKINAKKISDRYDKAELIIVRHIWEHVYDQRCFAEALKMLISNDGYILFEIPDCTKLLNYFDYTMIWEEHTYYFTPYTIKQSLQQYGFEILFIDSFEYPAENSINILVKINNSKKTQLDKIHVSNEIQTGARFAKKFKYQKNYILNYLNKMIKRGKIIMFGAGHQASAFITFLELENYISFVVDDNPNKIGLFMPKSKIPIVSSKEIYNTNVSICLLSMNPLHDEKMIFQFKDLKKKGVEIKSIYPTSNYFFSKK